jgi:CubicO group peptidase (beta-lactamase class C family)
MRVLIACALLTVAASPAFAISDAELRVHVEKRFAGDRTGACVAVAVVGQSTATTYVCANPKTARPFDARIAFEIGSVTKTMTAALLAEMIARGEIALGDSLATLLPPGTSVPSFNGRQIAIADIVTHTSGLPSIPPQWRMTDMNNPYASIAERDVLGALAHTRLTRAPGSVWEYSNFAMMVLSYAIAKRSGKDFETLLRERLFAPLGMNDSYIAKPPAGVRPAQGHLSNGMPTGPWDFQVDMAGVGGVRATLPDMVRYVEGQLGLRNSAITPALATTQAQIADVTRHRMGMNWVLATLNGRTLAAHEGGTGGFSSLVMFDATAKRGVVILSDTALTSLGGSGTLGLSLLDPAVAPGAPRVATTADGKLIDALVGHYRLSTGLGVELRHKGRALTIQADAQPEFELGHDSAGDFYPLQFDALLRPRRNADGSYTFTWFQGGDAVEAERTGGPAPLGATPAAR